MTPSALTAAPALVRALPALVIHALTTEKRAEIAGFMPTARIA
jgi:hypothetical protein